MSRSVEKPYWYSWLANSLTSSETPVTPAAPRLDSPRSPGKATHTTCCAARDTTWQLGEGQRESAPSRQPCPP